MAETPHPNIPLVAKMSVQQKIADLEARVAALEARTTRQTFTRSVTTEDVKTVSLQPELNGIFAHMDALFKKVFK